MALTDLTWQPLSLLNDLFAENLAALRPRDLKLADKLAAFEPANSSILSVAVEGDRVHVARTTGGRVEILNAAVDAASAGQIAAKLFPTGNCVEPVLVAGISQGWLWNTLYELPTHTPAAPGHRPPLFLLTNEIERLWIALHLHDWRKFLSDSRVRIFVGADAVAQLRESLCETSQIPLPRLSVTIEPALWNENQSIDSITHAALAAANARMQQYQSRAACRNAARVGAEATFASGRPLRVMGITSRFSTFLQYSMRDWLDAFEALGHQTHLVIEPHDSSLHNPVGFAEACDAFEPDLILMIDHYRAELKGLPENIPFVMWVQDQLDNIFTTTAGATQGRYDYTIGYGRNECVYQFGYPADRFRPVMIGTNEQRFQPRRLTHEERDAHTCDVSFVSHCSVPAEELLRQEIGKHPLPNVKACFSSVFEQLRAEYDAGRTVTMQVDFERIVNEALRSHQLTVDQPGLVMNFFTHKINNALFRHQSLRWLSEMDLRLNLYGRGWEQNAEFSRYARGVADNTTALSAIYQASKINLQVSPFGSAHQRVFDGLAAGGFFLLRQCPGDRADLLYRELWKYCAANRISCDGQLRNVRDEKVIAIIKDLTELNRSGLFDLGFDFVHELSIAAEADFTRNSATLWDEYPDVSYDSRDELQTRVTKFLANDAERASITRSMRSRVLEKMTYRSVANQTIELVQRDLQTNLQRRAA